ncbi:MAG: hypothetical protein V1850_06930 [Candidatus Bathyarchaeota archaeon]
MSWTARGFEAYNNVGKQTVSGLVEGMIRIRGGAVLVYNNQFTKTQSDTGSYTVKMDDENGDRGGVNPETRGSKIYIWGNTQTGASALNAGPYTLNVDYFLRAPTQAQDGVTYTPYPYPHQLTL